MHGARRHAEHAHLRRITAQKIQYRKASSLDSRSPQFGFGNGNGNGNGRGNGNGWGNDGGSGNSRFDRLTSWLGNRITAQRTSTTPIRAATNTPAPQPTATRSQAPVAPPTTPTPSPSPGSGSNGGGNNGNDDEQSTSRTSASANREANTSNTRPRVASETSTNAATETGIGGVSNVGLLDSVVPNGQTDTKSVPNATVDSGASPSGTTLVESGSSGPLVATGAAKTGLPISAIAAIVVIALLAFLLVLVLLVRRRWVSRRRNRMERWWSTNKSPSQDYNEKTRDFAPGLVQSNQALGNGLATGLDHASIVPAAPPVAEVRVPHSGAMDTSSPMVFGHPVSTSRRNLDSDRLSVGSSASNDSNSSKFFVVHHPVKNDSCRESFKFPKPPSLNTTSELASIHTRNGSGVSGSSYAAVCSTPLATKAPSGLSQPPITPPDPDQVDSAKGKDSSSAHNIPNPFLDSPTGTHSSNPSLANPFASNPFDDDKQSLASVGKFAGVETVRRLFQPTLADELEVGVNDRVAVLELFDDGWAMVEKIQDVGGCPQQKGLIPIACLREANQDLSSFLNTKVVPSYRVSSQMSD
ncbi:hypothetical protein MD484_g1552, partial [Candolleomyces efflorescens]